MVFAAILPNTNLYGGVKRFHELAAVLTRRGHEFIIYTPDGKPADWFHLEVRTRPLSTITEQSYDAVFITEFRFSGELMACESRLKVLYFVRASDSLKPLRELRGVEVFANSTNMYEIAREKGIEAYKAFGGVNTNFYQPKQLVPKKENDPIVIMTYGRLVERKKGTRLVAKACERLQRKGYRVELLLFDTPVNEKAKRKIEAFQCKVPVTFVVDHPVERNLELYHRADIFVAAEKNAGISNTAMEAMAAGIPLVATKSGTKDFLIHGETGILVSRWSWRIASGIERLINDFDYRKALAERGRKKIENFSWEALADTILRHPKLQ